MYNPYSWVRNDFSYQIETDYNIKYRLYFDDITALFSERTLGYPILTFSIELDGTYDLSGIPEDRRVADTIYALLSAFFQNDEAALVVVYDTIDGKEYARKRKFSTWYERFQVSNVEKHDYVTVDEGVEMPSSLLIHTYHPFKIGILAVYQELVDNGGYLL